jgi:Amt family ammonium transporter
MLGGISGAVAGLVAITPASGFVTPMSSLIIGFLAGLACFFMVVIVKNKLGYDDALDAFGVHGVGGLLGAILTGVFATNAVNNG